MKKKLDHNFVDGDTNSLQDIATGSLLLSSKGRVDFSDTEAVKDRINWFFSVCASYNLRPAPAGLSAALGINRRVLQHIVHNSIHVAEFGYLRNMPHEAKDIIMLAYNSLELLWEQYMSQGKINPASGIFLGKNNFGYVDEVQQTLNVSSDSFSQVEMKERYLIDVDSDDEN